MEKTLLRRQGKRKQVNLDENTSENQRKLARPSTVPEPEVFMEDLPVDVSFVLIFLVLNVSN